jgi:hypothetical protein
MKIISPGFRMMFMGLAFPSFACAHHAVSAAYEQDTSATLNGVVEEVFWANPHVHIYIRVSEKSHNSELWDIETSNLNTMSQRGWNRNRVRPGDRVTVTGTLGRNNSQRMLLDKLVMEDGTSLP